MIKCIIIITVGKKEKVVCLEKNQRFISGKIVQITVLLGKILIIFILLFLM